MILFDSCHECEKRTLGCHAKCEAYLLDSVIRSINKPKYEPLRGKRSKSYHGRKTLLSTHKRR